jgi:hypothetical protein
LRRVRDALAKLRCWSLELRGRLAAALGDATASDQSLRQALDLYREIGASGHAERLALACRRSSTAG